MSALHLVKAEAEWLNATQVASLIRRDLKAAFPGVKFSVTSKYFSMGSSVSIRWTDGPTTDVVDAALDIYKCQGFDGMTDSATNRGDVTLPDGRTVRISSWISTSRECSDALRARVSDWFDRHFAPGCYVGYEKERELNSCVWRAQIVNNCLIVRNR